MSHNSLRRLLKILFWGSVVVEGFVGIVIIILIAYRTVNNRRVGGYTRVVPLNRNNLIFPENAVFNNFYEPKPETTQEDLPSWLPEKAVYTINRDGLNERFDYSPEKPKDTYRIITLGDSFTFGQFVNTNNNWTELLEEALNKEVCGNVSRFEVINLGMSGYDLQYAAYRYHTRGGKYSPDLIIWLLNDHNFYIMPELYKSRFEELDKSMTDKEKQEAVKQGDFFPAWNKAISEVQKNYDNAKIIEQENKSFYVLAEDFTGSIVFISNNVKARYLGLVKVFMNYRKNPTYLDPRPVHLDDFPTYRFPDSHPNQQGHAYIQQFIYSYLKAEKLLPCNR